MKFTEEQLNLATALARSRILPKRERNIPSRKIDMKHSQFEMDLKGVLAEMVVADLLGCSVDSTVRLDGDDGYDLIWRGKTVQVKYSHHFYGNLFVNDTSELISDIYILVIGNETEMNPIGWAYREDFSKAEMIDFGYGKRLALSQNKLRKMSDINEMSRL